MACAALWMILPIGFLLAFWFTDYGAAIISTKAQTTELSWLSVLFAVASF